MTTELMEASRDTGMLTAAEMRARVNRLQEVLQAVMKQDVHYGKIPGTDKPTLFKAGAEKVLMTFRIAAVVKSIEDLGLPGEEARYRVTMQGLNQLTGEVLGEGTGECSSYEEKYKWRRPVHVKEYEAAPIDRKREKWQRNGEAWQQVRTESADIANTILKMAVKRALVAMTLVVTAASDVFAQDIEDLPEELRETAAGESGAATATPPLQPPQRKAAETPKAHTNGGAGEQSVAGLITRVTVKDGQKKDGTTWTRFGIQLGGEWHTTFSETLGLEAREHEAKKVPVTLTYKQGEQGRDLVRIQAVEREVGAEG